MKRALASAAVIGALIALGVGAWAQDSMDAVAATKVKVTRPQGQVVDSKGKAVGLYMPWGSTDSPGITIDAVAIGLNGAPVALPIGPGGFVDTCQNGLWAVFFNGANCTGDAFLGASNGTSMGIVMDAVNGSTACVKSNVVYTATPPFSSMTFASWSLGYGSDPAHVSICSNGSTDWMAGPMVTYDLTKLKLTPPFKIK